MITRNPTIDPRPITRAISIEQLRTRVANRLKWQRRRRLMWQVGGAAGFALWAAWLAHVWWVR
jgi:hypothetical protein